MKGYLKTALDISNPLFNAGVAKLERSTGNSSIDVRLIADITANAIEIIKSLGLDPKDTTGRELYHTILSSVKRDGFERLFEKSDYTLVIFDGQVISFNLIDIIENFHHEMPYERQITTHGKRSLCGEIVERYVSHPRTNDKTVRDIAHSIGLLEDECYNKYKK